MYRSCRSVLPFLEDDNSSTQCIVCSCPFIVVEVCNRSSVLSAGKTHPNETCCGVLIITCAVYIGLRMPDLVIRHRSHARVCFPIATLFPRRVGRSRIYYGWCLPFDNFVPSVIILARADSVLSCSSLTLLLSSRTWYICCICVYW